MKIALYIAYNNSSSVNCCKEVIDIVSAENDLLLTQKLRVSLVRNSKVNFHFLIHQTLLIIILTMFLQLVVMEQY